MKAFDSINASLATIAQQRWGAAPTPQRAPPPSTFPDPDPGLVVQGPIRAAPVVTEPPQLAEVIDSGTEVPRTPGREWQRKGSPTAISLHPSTTLEASNGEEPEEEPEGERSSHETRSEEDEPKEPGSFSSFETQLRLVQRDMVRVLKLPTDDTPGDSSDRRSFKMRTGGEETRSTPFPTLPLDRLCMDRIKSTAALKKWIPHTKRSKNYFQYPQKDCEDFFTVPTIPSTAKDKLQSDSGKASAKAIFADKGKARLEEQMRKIDEAARFGAKANAFLLLLSEYIVCACEEGASTPADMLAIAFRCLEEGLRMSLEQFTRISLQTTRSRRTNVLETLYIPYEGAKKKLEDISLLGNDLFGGQFQEVFETEAKSTSETLTSTYQSLRGTPDTSDSDIGGAPWSARPSHLDSQRHQGRSQESNEQSQPIHVVGIS